MGFAPGLVNPATVELVAELGRDKSRRISLGSAARNTDSNSQNSPSAARPSLPEPQTVDLLSSSEQEVSELVKQLSIELRLLDAAKRLASMPGSRKELLERQARYELCVPMTL